LKMNARVDTRAFVLKSIPFVAILGLLGCESRDSEKTQAEAKAPATGALRTTRDTAQAGGEVADSAALIEAQAWITDANALALLGVMNARQISAAEVELDSWHSDTVRAFAQVVAHEHAAQQRTTDSLAARLKIAPVMSALDLRIDSAFRARVDSLRALPPSSLERGFAHQQTVAEQAIADYADQLAGAVRAPEIRALTESAASAARARLTRANAFDASMMLADSLKKAAAADSAEKAAERAEARAAARAEREERAARKRRPPPA